MLRYRKLRTALASALRGADVDLTKLREDDRVLIQAVQAQRTANATLGARASDAAQNYKAQSIIVGALGERLHDALLGREAATA